MSTEIGPIKHGGKAVNLTSAVSDAVNNSGKIKKLANTPYTILTRQTTTFSFSSIKKSINILLNSELSKSEKIDFANLLEILEPVNIANSKDLIQEIIIKIQNSGLFFPRNINKLIKAILESGINESWRDELFNGVEEKLIISDLYAALNRVLEILRNKKFTGQKDLLKASKNLKRECKNLIKYLNKQQDKILNQDIKSNNNILFVLPWQNQNQPIFIRTGLNHSGKEKKNHTVFDLLITLDNIGTVRVNLLSIEKKYVVKLFVQSDEVKNYIQTKTVLLSESLKEQLYGISCIVQTSVESITSFFEKDEDIPFLHHVDIKA